MSNFDLVDRVKRDFREAVVSVWAVLAWAAAYLFGGMIYQQIAHDVWLTGEVVNATIGYLFGALYMRHLWKKSVE